MNKKIKLLLATVSILALSLVSFTGCVFQDGEGVWRSWGPNGNNQTYTGLDNNEYGYFYFKDGILDEDYNGFALNEYGFWLVQNGQVNFDYNGLYEDFLVANGRINTEYEGVLDNLLIVQGAVARDFTGVYGTTDANGNITNYLIENGVVKEGYIEYFCILCGDTLYTKSAFVGTAPDYSCMVEHLIKEHGKNLHTIAHWNSVNQKNLEECTYIDENGESKVDTERLLELQRHDGQFEEAKVLNECISERYV